MAQINVKTSEIQHGDIVLNYGMRILIDREIRTVPGHHVGPVYVTRGLVLNPDEVAGCGLVPESWLYDHNYGPEPRWVIQGNDLARWTVER